MRCDTIPSFRSSNTSSQITIHTPSESDDGLDEAILQALVASKRSHDGSMEAARQESYRNKVAELRLALIFGRMVLAKTRFADLVSFVKQESYVFCCLSAALPAVHVWCCNAAKLKRMASSFVRPSSETCTAPCYGVCTVATLLLSTLSRSR